MKKKKKNCISEQIPSSVEVVKDWKVFYSFLFFKLPLISYLVSRSHGVQVIAQYWWPCSVVPYMYVIRTPTSLSLSLSLSIRLLT
jgi:hypothetical protein